MDQLQAKNLAGLRERFTECTENYEPYSFLKIRLPFDAGEVKRALQKKKKCKIYCVIPEFVRNGKLPSRFEIYDAYRRIFTIAAGIGIKTAFNFETGLEALFLGDEDEGDESLAAENLVMHSYRCTECESVSYNLHKGELMSIVAYDGNSDIIDLREYVDNSVLRWTVPRGNWDILEFTSVPDLESKRINYLNYNTSRRYILEIAEELCGMIGEMKPESLAAIKYNDIGFITKNRRMWAKNFNESFIAKYGFDPAPFYPVLFFDVDKDTSRIRAQLLECRAQLLAGGFCKAAHDFALKYGISCIGGFIEPKLAACSAITGDTQLVNSYNPSALLNKAYLYGINSVKVAAGAAYCFDKNTVNCDVYRHYEKIDLDIAYKDAMHAFARGANRLILHSPDLEEENAPSLFKSITGEEDVTDFSTFVTRVQSVLKGGRHVSDIALLYPVYSSHAKTYFYDCEVDGFEYPDLISNLDYMSVINSISFYSGHDLTIIHPTAFNTFCSLSGDRIKLDNGNSRESYKVLVIPATSVISLRSLELAASFFDNGGKIIATGELPKYAIESTEEVNLDEKVVELVKHIFGEDAASDRIMRRYCENKNENGGIAYMLYFSLTAADGTNMVDSHLINSALESFDVPYDISLPEMARYESTGALNAPYPAFKKLGLSNHLRNGGMINYIHKRRGDIDIYFLSNTTTLKLCTPLILRGKLDIEEWNPHTGKAKKHTPTYKERTFEGKSVDFTEIELSLEPAKSVILIGTPQ